MHKDVPYYWSPKKKQQTGVLLSIIRLFKPKDI